MLPVYLQAKVTETTITRENKDMNTTRTAKAMFLAGMMAAIAPMGAAAADTGDDLQQEIIEQGNAALEAMSIRLVQQTDWGRQVSRQLADQLAEQAFTPETATVSDCPRAVMPTETKKKPPVARASGQPG